MNKPTHVKPALYAMYYEFLKEIAKDYGYNLLLHGSMHRDLDLVAVPWDDNPRSEQDMIKEFQKYMSGAEETRPNGDVNYTILAGGRHSYVIELNRGNKHGEWVRFEDKQYYLDISVVQLPYKKLLTAHVKELYSMYSKEEITFSRFVEMLNESKIINK